MMPEHKRIREAEERALAMTKSADFLTPEWGALSPINVVTMREAVALACGINKRF